VKLFQNLSSPARKRGFLDTAIPVFAGLTLFFLFIGEVRADFKLLDAIEEFGEKRFVKASPSRIPAGPLRIHPLLRKSVTYDDNILLEPDDARSDIVYKIQPGAILELPIQDHQIAMGYEAEFELFTKRRHRESNNDVNQNFFALADLHFSDWYINVLEYLSETSGRAGTTFTGRIPRIDHSINPKIGYKWNRTTFEAGFRHYTRDFRQQVNDSFDFTSTEWTGVVYYDLFARLKALVDYQIAKIDYDDNRDRVGLVNQARLGLEGEPYTNLFTKIRIGPQFRNYYRNGQKDYNSVVVDIQLEYKVRSNIKVKAKMSREPVEATFGSVNFYTEHLASLGFEYEFRPRWTLYEETAFFKHHYAERETVNVQTGFRRDAHLSLKTGVKYAFREWWELDLNYEFLHRDSNFPDFDYDDNRFTFASNMAY
jgi:hypothetical protein